jgi:hypothetical protein
MLDSHIRNEVNQMSMVVHKGIEHQEILIRE